MSLLSDEQLEKSKARLRNNKHFADALRKRLLCSEPSDSKVTQLVNSFSDATLVDIYFDHMQIAYSRHDLISMRRRVREILASQNIIVVGHN